MRTLTTEAERNASFLQLGEKGEGGSETFGTPNAEAAAIHRQCGGVIILRLSGTVLKPCPD